MKNQAFYDNADAALDLPKRASYQSPEVAREVERRAAEKTAYLQEHGIADETDLLRTVPRNVGAHDELGVRMQKYIGAGYGTLEAIAAAEAEMVEAEGVDDDILGASVEELMKPPVTPDKHSSRSRSKKPSRGGSDPLQREVMRTYGRVA